jgi:hypothetical protein
MARAPTTHCKELQRHRFGRRAESLPVDQLLLGLEEAEQVDAEGLAGEDATDPAKGDERATVRRTNRGSLPAQPIRHLAGFAGIFQVDGYAGYRVLAERTSVRLAFRWSHVRRRFYELAAAGPAPIATEALARIAELYRIEGEIRGRPAEERRASRQARSFAVVAALGPWLRDKLALVSQKSKLAEAIRYALSRWAGLCRFLDPGRVEIDMNIVERSIRPIDLNLKNGLFGGSDGGAGTGP